MEKMRPMKVRYTIDALFHIAATHSYINERNPVAAARVIARLKEAAELLDQSPRIGHAGRRTEHANGSSPACRMSSCMN